MILRLRLSNWRAYDTLDVELGPGATFIVASNGIGKTSLVMGAAWGLFGDIAGVRGAEEIRGDAESATVTVDLRLPSGETAEIVRTVDHRGKQTVSVSAGERTLGSQDELDVLLADAYGADARVLAQLTVMVHGGLHETQGEFELRDHLAQLFGVRPLYEAGAQAEATAAEAASELRKLKVVERKDRRARDELEAELAAIQARLDTASSRREAAVAAANAAAEALRVATEWAGYREALQARGTRLSAYAEVASSLLDRPIAPDAVLDELAAVEAEEERGLSALETEAAAARGRAEFIRDALAHLEASDATCPTCLRPFAEHDAERAAAEHGRQLQELDRTIADAQARAEERRAVLASLRSVLADIRSLPLPAEPVSSEPADDAGQVRGAHDAARDELQAADQEVAVQSAALAAVREELAEADRDREQTGRIDELLRLEALAAAAAQTSRETADAIMQQHIEPLVAEVARRWKQTFGRGGLHLSAEGRITRRVGSRTLAFGALSGGERVWALLVARLLVAGASTRAPFVWLDEPLEHLDPRLRRIVAGTLAMASSGAGLRQVIVTTYEAPIAQQLMEDVPAASLIYVTSAE